MGPAREDVQTSLCIRDQHKHTVYQPVWLRSWQPASQSSSSPVEAGVCWGGLGACQPSAMQNTRSYYFRWIYIIYGVCARLGEKVLSVQLQCTQQGQTEFKENWLRWGEGRRGEADFIDGWWAQKTSKDQKPGTESEGWEERKGWHEWKERWRELRGKDTTTVSF